MVRSPSSSKQTAGLKKGPWTSDEDEILTNHIKIHGHPNWRALPRLAGLARCGKSCRLRWTNYLQPGIKRGNFTREEEEIIINSHQLLGNRWSAIAARLPGRTDNEIKNVWHTHLKKKVLNKEDSQQQSSTTIDQSSDSRDDDVIFVDESIFDQVWEDRSNLVQQHAHADHDDPTENPNNVSASNTDSHDIYAPSLLLQRSDSEASYNNYKEVPSPEEFPETNESFWSDVLSSDYDHHDNSGSSSVENYYPCYHHQQPVLDNNTGIMETDPQQAYISSFPDVDSGKLNVSDHSNTVQDCGDVDDFWFDVLFRAGEHPAFLDM